MDLSYHSPSTQLENKNIYRNERQPYHSTALHSMQLKTCNSMAQTGGGAIQI